MIQSYRPMDDAIVTNGVVEQSDVSDVQRAFEDPSFLYRGRLDRRRMGSQTAQLALQQHTIPRVGRLRASTHRKERRHSVGMVVAEQVGCRPSTSW
jgi:hypothetical protein